MPIAVGLSPRVSDMRMKVTAEAIAKPKLLAPLVIASARNTGLRPTKSRPSTMSVRRCGSGLRRIFGSRTRIDRSAVQYQRDGKFERPLPAGDQGPRPLPVRAGRAEMPVSGDQIPGPDRCRPGQRWTMRWWSRPGARCRHCCRSVSPGRSPNGACAFQRTRLSTIRSVKRGSFAGMGWEPCCPGSGIG